MTAIAAINTNGPTKLFPLDFVPLSSPFLATDMLFTTALAPQQDDTLLIRNKDRQPTHYSLRAV
jgi:hypothetical protein